MHFEQIYLGCLAQASYLIGDEQSGEAVVVDPRRDVGIYLEKAEALGLTIRHVLLTHFHADFLSGHIELRERCGAKIWVGAGAEPEFEAGTMGDGGSLEVGKVVFEFLSTPGHTPESTSIVVREAGADKPYAVLTGDTLFVGDVGRPDLMASVGITERELAEKMYHSLRDKLLPLPDETLVYPAHGAGSLCGKSLGSENHSTMGAERTKNWALQEQDLETFVATLTAEQPTAPSYFAYDAQLNKAERPTLDQALERQRRALSLEEVLELAKDGAQILDTRSADAWCERHLLGSIFIGLDGKFATWCGFVLDREKPIVVVAEPGREEEAMIRLGRIGLDIVAGYLDGGIAATEGRDELVGAMDRLQPAELDEQLASDAPPLVVDVRGPGEWEAGHHEGAVTFPLQTLAEHVADVPRDRPLAVHCKGGYRSVIAASLLRRDGVKQLVDVVGGYDAWKGAACST